MMCPVAEGITVAAAMVVVASVCINLPNISLKSFLEKPKYRVIHKSMKHFKN
jgi:hypothetical protein